MTVAYRADLHTHSSCSDGTLSPVDLLQHAITKGLQGISITDHDTIKAYSDLSLPVNNSGELIFGSIKVLSGIEFSTRFDDKVVHLLGYAFNPKDSTIEAACQEQRLKRFERNEAILTKLKKHGIDLSIEELYTPSSESLQLESIGRPHIAKLLVKRGVVKDFGEAFRLYLSDYAPCYVASQSLSTEMAIEVIHAAKGKAVLAHPHLLTPSIDKEKLLKLPFDGIEAYYAGYVGPAVHVWKEVAQKHSLFITGGSDFHGDSKPKNVLGTSWTPWQQFEELLALQAENLH